MDFSALKDRLKKDPVWKKRIHNLIMHPVKTRPRWTTRLFQFVYLKRGKSSVIYRSVRKDLVPFNKFSIGDYSVVEDYSILNNAVGDVTIGSYTRIGLGNTIIGPVQIGNHVNFAQNVVLSGLNHNYKEVDKPISEQGVSTLPIIIGDDVWVGANAVITAGVKVGEHSVIGAGTVLTRDVPPYSIAVGNPAQIVKKYDFDKKEWVKSI